jgi:hypothetical protein
MLRTRNGLCELSSISVVVKHKPHQVFSVNHPALRVSTRGLEQRVNKQSPQSRFAVSEKTAIECKCCGSSRLRAIAELGKVKSWKCTVD